jgi:hypothetical protein
MIVLLRGVGTTQEDVAPWLADGGVASEEESGTMRTLMRAGCRAYLVRVDQRGGPLFLVSGPEHRGSERFHELGEANAWFETLERGQRPRKERRVLAPWLRHGHGGASHHPA